MFRSPSSGYPRPGGGGAAGPAMWQWQNNNGSADPALTPTTTEGVDMLSMLGRTHTHPSRVLFFVFVKKNWHIIVVEPELFE